MTWVRFELGEWKITVLINRQTHAFPKYFFLKQLPVPQKWNGKEEVGSSIAAN